MKRKKPAARKDSHDALREHVVKLLDWQDAHRNFDAIVADWPPERRGAKPAGAPHSPWQLLEHLRICQRDILDFCRNSAYREMPLSAYWPASEAPPSPGAWEKSLAAVRADLAAMQKLVTDPTTDLFARIPWGNGQTWLRQALLVADHNAYHLGQLVLVRRLQGAWRD